MATQNERITAIEQSVAAMAAVMGDMMRLMGEQSRTAKAAAKADVAAPVAASPDKSAERAAKRAEREAKLADKYASHGQCCAIRPKPDANGQPRRCKAAATQNDGFCDFHRDGAKHHHIARIDDVVVVTPPPSATPAPAPRAKRDMSNRPVCKGRKADGTSCRSVVVDASGYCPAHRSQKPKVSRGK